MFYIALLLIILFTTVTTIAMLKWAFKKYDEIYEEVTEIKRKSFIKYPNFM